MPRLIRDGAIVEDRWLPAEPDNPAPSDNHVLGLEQWLALEDRSGEPVQLEPGQAPTPLFTDLDTIPLIMINFPAFMDGRGFSYARELRERGYRGELRAVGHFIRDQLNYLQRCGFNAFQMADQSQLEEALGSLDDFTEYYQAAIDQPLPLFRRRI